MQTPTPDKPASDKTTTGFRIQIRNNNNGTPVTVPDPVTFSYAVVPLPTP